MEFSKKILLIAFISTTLVVLFSCVLMWRTGDLSPLNVILGGLFAEITAGTGFYYWKAKNENVLKIKNSKEDLNDELDN